MNANIHHSKIKVYQYKSIKTNKQDTIYQISEPKELQSFLTEFVKVEKYQGYSNAYNLGLYFRIKNESSWAKSKQITGLWKLSNPYIFYGDIKQDKNKTLLLFFIEPNKGILKVFEFPTNYYPSKSTIELLSLKINL
jgi:hypothetical protein